TLLRNRVHGFRDGFLKQEVELIGLVFGVKSKGNTLAPSVGNRKRTIRFLLLNLPFFGYTLSMDEQSTHHVESRTEAASSTRRGGFGWCFWAAMFLVVYFLSIGPVERLDRNGILPPSFIAIYRPITILCWYSKPAQKFYHWYIELWCPHIPGTL